MRHLSTVILLISSSTLCLADCFWRNGTKRADPSYKPCSSDSTNPLHTVCCRDTDECLRNGLCKGGTDNSPIYWRETCTNSDWGVGGCQDICSLEETQKANDVAVIPCDGTSTSTTWCCGDISGGGNKDCCAESSNLLKFNIANVFGDAIPTSTFSTTSSATLSISSTAGQQSSSTAVQQSSSTVGQQSPSPTVSTPASASAGGLSSGAKAGIGIGAAIGALALVGLGIFIAKALRWKEKARRTAGDGAEELDSQYTERYGYVDGGYPAGHMQETKMASLAPAPIFEAPPAETRELPTTRD